MMLVRATFAQHPTPDVTNTKPREPWENGPLTGNSKNIVTSKICNFPIHGKKQSVFEVQQRRASQPRKTKGREWRRGGPEREWANAFFFIVHTARQVSGLTNSPRGPSLNLQTSKRGSLSSRGQAIELSGAARRWTYKLPNESSHNLQASGGGNVLNQGQAIELSSESEAITFSIFAFVVLDHEDIALVPIALVPAAAVDETSPPLAKASFVKNLVLAPHKP